MKDTPKPIVVRASSTVGRVGSPSSLRNAARMAGYSTRKSLPSSTTCTFHPSELQPAARSWGITSPILPLICSSFQSTKATRRRSPNLTAKRRASLIWPFCCSPSPMSTSVRQSRWRRTPASAAATPADSPWPRLPVFQYTPGTQLSTCPEKGVPARRKLISASSIGKYPASARVA